MHSLYCKQADPNSVLDSIMLDTLVAEVVEHILGFLDKLDLFAVQLVCGRLCLKSFQVATPFRGVGLTKITLKNEYTPTPTIGALYN
jgi:hypothetical protein